MPARLVLGVAHLLPENPSREQCDHQADRKNLRERARYRHRNFLDDYRRLLSGERLPEPDPESGKQAGDQRAVDLHRMLDDQEAVLRQFQDRNEHAAAHAVEQDVAHCATAQTRGGFPRQGHGRP
jgi:hypothetical protein